MNKCRASKIPPLLVNNLFILNCREKAQYFNDYFSQQRNPVNNNSVLPILGFLTNKRLGKITIKDNKIISLIRKINPNKATGSDGISGQTLLLCDESVILPQILPQIIFTNILTTSVYPTIWKLANEGAICKYAICNMQMLHHFIKRMIVLIKKIIDLLVFYPQYLNFLKG